MILKVLGYRSSYRVSQLVKTAVERQKELLQSRDLQEFAKYEYKSYPYHISHYDPESPEYIASERDDFRRRIEVDTYNNMLDKLKHDLKMQKQLNFKVDEALASLDRPYLRGKPGVTRNVSGGLKDYFPPEVDHEQVEDPMEESLNSDPIYRNEKRWISQTLFPHLRPSWHADWELQRDQRPVNPHYNPDKGSKYDVEIPYEQRYPYLADRLGHPEFLAHPLQRLARMEADIYHPNFNDQPFVQKPSYEPDPSLTFEEGEVIYENTRLQEWVKLQWWLCAFGYTWSVVAAPYLVLYKTNMPTDVMLEGNYYPYHLRSIYNFDYLKLHVLGLILVVTYGAWATFGGFNMVANRYLTKLQYNKDKELLFATAVDGFGNVIEQVYESHHIEFQPYVSKAATKYMRHNLDDGMYEMRCFNQFKGFFLYKNDNYWNPKLKKEFIINHSQLITKQHFGMRRFEQEEYEKVANSVPEQLPVEPYRP